MAKVKYGENAIINDGKLPAKVWLDPSKRGSSRVVPLWEGTSNRDPRYMDTALYCMNKIDKDMLKETIKRHSHMSITELLSLMMGVPEETAKTLSYVLPKYEPRSAYIIGVSPDQLGYIIGFTTSSMLERFTASAAGNKQTLDDNEKYDAALIEFENYGFEKVGLNIPKTRILTMYDDNFILSKECEFIEIEDIVKHVLEWEYPAQECYGL